MTLRDRLLPLADRLRAIPEAMGLRTITVYLRTDDSVGGAFGTDGAVTSVTHVALSPQPKVVRVGEVPSFHAAESDLAKAQSLALYRVGPITPRSLDGTGYDLSDLLPEPGTPERRVGIALSGAEIGDTPVPFEVIPDGADLTALHLVITVRQSQTL